MRHPTMHAGRKYRNIWKLKYFTKLSSVHEGAVRKEVLWAEANKVVSIWWLKDSPTRDFGIDRGQLLFFIDCVDFLRTETLLVSEKMFVLIIVQLPNKVMEVNSLLFFLFFF